MALAVVCSSMLHAADADDVLAILSSESGYYKEALAGFRETLARPIVVTSIEKGKPTLAGRPKVIVAFGGKAALIEQDAGVPLVACLAPGLQANHDRFNEPFIYIEMAPPPNVLLENIKKIQPQMKRFAVFWGSEPLKPYVEKIRQAAILSDTSALFIKIEDPSAFPARLREIKGNVDAILLLPDPFLVNSQNFTTVKDFSWDNRIPFYVPTKGLVELGGMASISSSFKEVGAAAARATLKILEGKKSDEIVFPEKVDIAINLEAVKNAGLKIPPEVLQQANEVFQ